MAERAVRLSVTCMWVLVLVLSVSLTDGYKTEWSDCSVTCGTGTRTRDNCKKRRCRTETRACDTRVTCPEPTTAAPTTSSTHVPTKTTRRRLDTTTSVTTETTSNHPMTSTAVVETPSPPPTVKGDTLPPFLTTVSTSVSSSSSNTTAVIPHPSSGEADDKSVTAAIVGGVLGVLLAAVAVIALCCWRHRNQIKTCLQAQRTKIKSRRDHTTNPAHPDDYGLQILPDASKASNNDTYTVADTRDFDGENQSTQEYANIALIHAPNGLSHSQHSDHYDTVDLTEEPDINLGTLEHVNRGGDAQLMQSPGDSVYHLTTSAELPDEHQYLQLIDSFDDGLYHLTHPSAELSSNSQVGDVQMAELSDNNAYHLAHPSTELSNTHGNVQMAESPDNNLYHLANPYDVPYSLGDVKLTELLNADSYDIAKPITLPSSQRNGLDVGLYNISQPLTSLNPDVQLPDAELYQLAHPYELPNNHGDGHLIESTDNGVRNGQNSQNRSEDGPADAFNHIDILPTDTSSLTNSRNEETSSSQSLIYGNVPHIHHSPTGADDNEQPTAPETNQNVLVLGPGVGQSDTDTNFYSEPYGDYYNTIDEPGRDDNGLASPIYYELDEPDMKWPPRDSVSI